MREEKLLVKYRSHLKLWSKCKKCQLGEYAHKHALGRGRLPCGLLFIGEAPGKSEDILGEPFVGPSGKILDRMIKDAFSEYSLPPLVYITNLVGCRPTDGVGEPNRLPNEVEINTCRPRLEALLRLAKPKAIVLVGKTAEHYAMRLTNSNQRIVSIAHPAFILRRGGNSSDPYYLTAVGTIRRAWGMV